MTNPSGQPLKRRASSHLSPTVLLVEDESPAPWPQKPLTRTQLRVALALLSPNAGMAEE